eukprot:20528-Eustigmatos_ZCMA.PRE.1
MSRKRDRDSMSRWHTSSTGTSMTQSSLILDYICAGTAKGSPIMTILGSPVNENLRPRSIAKPKICTPLNVWPYTGPLAECTAAFELFTARYQLDRLHMKVYNSETDPGAFPRRSRQ